MYPCTYSVTGLVVPMALMALAENLPECTLRQAFSAAIVQISTIECAASIFFGTDSQTSPMPIITGRLSLDMIVSIAPIWLSRQQTICTWRTTGSFLLAPDSCLLESVPKQNTSYIQAAGPLPPGRQITSCNKKAAKHTITSARLHP